MRCGYAVDLLDLGAPAYAVVAHLRRRCGISRSVAYRDVQDVEDIRRKRGYEPQNSARESLELSQRLLVQAQLEALAEGDLKVLARLSKELREATKPLASPSSNQTRASRLGFKQSRRKQPGCKTTGILGAGCVFSHKSPIQVSTLLLMSAMACCRSAVRGAERKK